MIVSRLYYSFPWTKFFSYFSTKLICKKNKKQSWNLEVLAPNTWNKTQSCKRNAVINWWNSGLSHIYGKEKSIIYNKRKNPHLNPKEKTKWAYRLLGTSGFFKLIVTKASCSIPADFLDQLWVLSLAWLQ